MSRAAELCVKEAAKAQRYAADRRALSREGDAVARRVLKCAERVEALDERFVDAEAREAALSDIWAAYAVVSRYLSSFAPNQLAAGLVAVGDFNDVVDASGEDAEVVSLQDVSEAAYDGGDDWGELAFVDDLFDSYS